MVTLSSTQIASKYLQVRIGGDVAALKGVCKALLELDVQARSAGEAPLLDDDFISAHTTGYDDFAADIRQTTWESIERCAGLLREDLAEVARVYGAAKATIACWGMGITQHVTGTQNVQQIVNLLLLKGNIGRPARASARCGATRTSRATERSASRSGRAKPSSTGCAMSLPSSRRASTAIRWWRASRPCAAVRRRP